MAKGAGTRRRSGCGVKAEPLYPAVGADGCERHTGGDGAWSPEGRRIHLIGIGGCGMRGAAAVLLRAGAKVSGSDRAESAALERLAERGADIHVGQRAGNLPERCDLVVKSAAVHDSNPELVSARDRGLDGQVHDAGAGRNDGLRVELGHHTILCAMD